MALSARLALIREGFDLDVAFEVPAGETLVVLGPNGAGKSTLLAALAGLVPLSRGRLEVGGVLFEAPEEGVRLPPSARQVGFAPQDLALFGHLSALDNVAYGPRARGLGRALARARAARWLEAVNASHLGARRTGSLSGGEARRVALARALATEPALLLLDEPMSGLDVAAVALVRASLRAARASLPAPCVLVAHDPLDAIALGDRALVLEAGRAVQVGALLEVQERPKTPWTARLFGKSLLEGALEARGGALGLAVAGAFVPIEARAPLGTGDRARVALGPRALALADGEGPAGRTITARLARAQLMGEAAQLILESPVALVVEVPAARLFRGDLAPGAEVKVVLPEGPLAAYT